MYGGFPISILSDFFGTERIAGAVGFRAIPMGVLLLIVPTFTGYLVDAYGNYNPVQYVCVVHALLSSALIAVCYYVLTKRRAREELTVSE